MAARDMDWTYPAGAGDSGIFEIGRRLAEALGRAPDATRFTYDPRTMLRTTRDIERASRGGRLLVGFQVAAKFDVEADRYRALLAAGTRVTAWAAGQRAQGHGLDDLDYRALPPDARRLENQWFLVTDSMALAFADPLRAPKVVVEGEEPGGREGPDLAQPPRSVPTAAPANRR